MQLNEIVEHIETAFGEASPVSGSALAGPDIEALSRIFADEGYQGFLQDQVNRQIILDYLVNAVLLGVINESRLGAFADEVSTEEGRAVMSLHMLMSSVEDANDLPVNGEKLKQLRPGPDSPPHMKLVPN